MDNKPAFRDHHQGDLSSFADLMRELKEFRQQQPPPTPLPPPRTKRKKPSGHKK